ERVDEITQRLVIRRSTGVAGIVAAPEAVVSMESCITTAGDQAVKELLERCEIAIRIGHVGVMMVRHPHACMNLNPVARRAIGEAVADEVGELLGLGPRRQQHQFADAAAGDLIAAARVDRPSAYSWVVACAPASTVLRSPCGTCLLLCGGGHAWLSAPHAWVLQVFGG